MLQKKKGQLVLDKKKWDEYRESVKELPEGDKLLNGLDHPQAQRILSILQVLTTEDRAGYFPRFRFGDKAVAVYEDTIGLDQEKDYRLIRMEVIPDKTVARMGNIPGIGDAAKRRVEKKRQEKVKELQAEYSNKYKVIPLDLTLDSKRGGAANSLVIQAVGRVQALAEIAMKGKENVMDSPDVKKFLELIENELAMTRAESLTRKRRNIPGYLHSGNNDGSYYKEAIQAYIDTGSNVASSLYEEPAILEAMEEIRQRVKGGEDSNLWKVANRTFEYINDPNNEAVALRGYAFHMFLGFNLSSAVINLTQTVQATYPILGSITGMAKGAVM